MYLCKINCNEELYWLITDTTGQGKTSPLAKVFELPLDNFLLSEYDYRIEGKKVIGGSCNDVFATILLELSNTYTYEKLMKYYPELGI